MPVKKFNPVTPGTRQRVANAFTELTSATPEKSLIAKQSKSGGRNNEGHRTVRYKGGGHKRPAAETWGEQVGPIACSEEALGTRRERA